MTNESSLYVPAMSYVQAVVDLLAGNLPKEPPRIMVGLKDWVRSDNAFVSRDREEPYWVRGIASRSEVLHALPEYRLYVQALENESSAVRHIGPVSTAGRGGRGITVQELADTLLWRMVERRGGFEFDEAEFALLFEGFEDDLRRDFLEYVAVAPIPGFKSNLDSIPLATDLELAKLDDVELIQCLRMSIYPGLDLGEIVFASETYGLRCRFSEKKFFGAVPSEEIKRAQDKHKDMVARFSQVVRALRLFKRGTLSIAGVVIGTEQWPLNGVRSAFRINHDSGRDNNYQLAAVERDGFLALKRE